MGRHRLSGGQSFRDVEAVARTVVRAHIDLRDRTFAVLESQRPGASRVDRIPEVLCFSSRFLPLLWRSDVPYTVLWGFPLLAIAPPPNVKTVRVVLLEDLVENASVVDAMAIACGEIEHTRPRLSTLECARAVRGLARLGGSEREVQELLLRVDVSDRTASRARRIAGASEERWNALESGSLTVTALDALERRGGAGPGGSCDAGSPSETSSDKHRVSTRLSASDSAMASLRGACAASEDARRAPSSQGPRGPRRSGKDTAPRPLYRLTQKKRLVFYHTSLGIRDDPERLRSVLDSMRDAGVILTRWLEKDAGSAGEARPSPNSSDER